MRMQKDGFGDVTDCVYRVFKRENGSFGIESSTFIFYVLEEEVHASYEEAYKKAEELAEKRRGKNEKARGGVIVKTYVDNEIRVG